MKTQNTFDISELAMKDELMKREGSREQSNSKASAKPELGTCSCLQSSGLYTLNSLTLILFGSNHLWYLCESPRCAKTTQSKGFERYSGTIALLPFLTSDSVSSGFSISASCSARNFSASSAAIHPDPSDCQLTILSGILMEKEERKK